MSDGILVACIGNIFLGDDSFGCEVAQALARCDLPAGVEARDYGIRGYDLAWQLLRPWKAIVLVDTVARGGQPGTLYLLEPSGSEPPSDGPALDPHAMDPVQVLAAARSLGEINAAVYIVGCEPQDFGEDAEGRMGLSAPVAAAVPRAVVMIRELAEKWAPAATELPAERIFTTGGNG